MKKENLKLDSLKKALLSLDKRQLSDIRKKDIKSVVFRRCNFDLIDQLSAMNSVELEQFTKISVRERIFEMINNGVNGMFWSFKRLARYTTSFAVFMFAFFAIFNFMTIDQGIVFAKKPSIFKNVTGNVFVERNGDTFHVENGMFVAEGDRIITNGGGVTIRFFDDTESRLGSSSEVVIDKLSLDELNEAVTNIEISVVDGAVWSNVVNLVGDSNFTVTADDVEAVVDHSASFNVQVKSDYSAVEVYNNVVKVKSNEFDGHVVKGNVVAVENGESVDSVVDNEWTEVNLSEDIIHEESVDVAILSNKIKIASIVDARAEFSDDVYVKSENIDDLKASFKSIENQFIVADVKLNVVDSDVEVVEAEVGMSEFHTVVEGIYSEISEVRVGDEALAIEMTDYIDGRLEILEKSVAMAEPGTPEYLGVDVLNDLKIIAAIDEGELADVKIEIGLAKLANVDGIIESGDIDLAVDVLSDGVSMIDDVSEIVSDDIMPDYLVALDLAQEYENKIDDIDSSGDVVLHNSAEVDESVSDDVVVD